MNAIMAALRSGIAPGVVHSMVDMAAAALRITAPAPAPTPASPPRHRTLPADPHADHPGHTSPRPSVSSPKQQGQVKRGRPSGLKSVLKTGAVGGPGEHDKGGRVESDAAAGTGAPAMLDAPYRYHNSLITACCCCCMLQLLQHQLQRGLCCLVASKQLLGSKQLPEPHPIAPECHERSCPGSDAQQHTGLVLGMQECRNIAMHTFIHSCIYT